MTAGGGHARGHFRRSTARPHAKHQKSKISVSSAKSQATTDLTAKCPGAWRSVQERLLQARQLRDDVRPDRASRAAGTGAGPAAGEGVTTWRSRSSTSRSGRGRRASASISARTFTTRTPSGAKTPRGRTASRCSSIRCSPRPVLGPLPPAARGRTALDVPLDQFDKEHRRMQLASFRTKDRMGPAISGIVVVPVPRRRLLTTAAARLLPRRADRNR